MDVETTAVASRASIGYLVNFAAWPVYVGSLDSAAQLPEGVPTMSPPLAMVPLPIL